MANLVRPFELPRECVSCIETMQQKGIDLHCPGKDIAAMTKQVNGIYDRAKEEGRAAEIVANVLFGNSAAAGILAGGEKDGMIEALDICARATLSCEGPVVFSKSTSPDVPYIARSAGFESEQEVETPQLDAPPGPWYSLRATVDIDTSHLRDGSFVHVHSNGSDDDLILNESRIVRSHQGVLSPWGVVDTLRQIIASAGKIDKVLKQQ